MGKTVVFDDQDQMNLAKTLNLRLRIVDVIANKKDSDLPTKPSDLLAIAQLAASVDKTVIDRAKIRADNERNDNNEEANRDLMLALMREIHVSNHHAVPVIPVPGHEPPEYMSNTELAVNSGELIRRQDDVGIEGSTD